MSTFVSSLLPARYWSKVEASHDGCWNWVAGKNRDGYGVFGLDGRQWRAHRLAYEVLVRPVERGLELDHLCRNRACVNPAHLEPVTHRENLLRGKTGPGLNAGKTHCPKGHEYTPENTYRGVTRAGTPTRVCATCRKEYSRRHYARRRAAA